MQTQIRRHKMWRLIRIYIVFLKHLPSKIELKRQNRPDTPKMSNGLVKHITVKNSLSVQWVKSWKENPEKLTQLSSRSHTRHLKGKRTASKDITIDTTSDSQVNSNFPNRWSPASLTFNNYFYLFLYLYIT